VTFSFRDDAVVVHANAGAVRPPERSAHHGTWGLGAEFRLNERVYFIPEVFNQVGGRPMFQAGFRYWILPGRLQADATYGDRIGSSNGGRWFSAGVRILTPAFLPWRSRAGA
jgi:hypothetical protein